MESNKPLRQEKEAREGEPHGRGLAQPRVDAEVARLRAEIARLEGGIRLRDQRTELVMHELRQPLNLLVLVASRLAKYAQGDQQRELEGLRVHGLRLNRLVSDLSDASLLESGRFALHLASTDLVGLTEGALEQHEPRPHVSVEGDIPPVDADPRRVEQILTNLLVNAQKHGSAHSAPRIAIARKDGVVVVSVTNEGGGISDDERTKVFEPYYRGRSRAPGARGLGLGLYICRRLVEEHGGKIWTDGDASHTRVSFSLPILEAEDRPSGTHLVVRERA